MRSGKARTMTGDVTIRRGRVDDAERLKEIGVTGWETTYQDFVTPENRRRYLAGPFWSIPRLRQILRDPDCLALVAEVNGRPSGFLTIEPRHRRQMELTRLYVDPENRRGGVGQALLKHALEHLRQRGVRDLTVNVFGDNVVGRRFYERTGFTLVEETTTTVGNQTVYDVWYSRSL